MLHLAGTPAGAGDGPRHVARDEPEDHRVIERLGEMQVAQLLRPRAHPLPAQARVERLDARRGELLHLDRRQVGQEVPFDRALVIGVRLVGDPRAHAVFQPIGQQRVHGHGPLRRQGARLRLRDEPPQLALRLALRREGVLPPSFPAAPVRRLGFNDDVVPEAFDAFAGLRRQQALVNPSVRHGLPTL